MSKCLRAISFGNLVVGVVLPQFLDHQSEIYIISGITGPLWYWTISEPPLGEIVLLILLLIQWEMGPVMATSSKISRKF